MSTDYRDFDWLNDALCVKWDTATVDYWDESDPTTDKAKVALAVCDACPVQRQCLEWVEPRSGQFSGVCGARVWRDGQDVTDG